MVYSWAYALGSKMIKRLEGTYREDEGPDVDRISKHVERILLNLRSEALPEKFRRELMNIVIEESIDVGIPEEVKRDRPWRVDEFYRLSTQVLAGLHDALTAWKESKQKRREGEREVGS